MGGCLVRGPLVDSTHFTFYMQDDGINWQKTRRSLPMRSEFAKIEDSIRNT
jgi:hypothetical protein